MTKVAAITVLTLFFVGIVFFALFGGQKTESLVTDIESTKVKASTTKELDLSIEPGVFEEAINVRFVDYVVMAQSNIKKGQKFGRDSVIEIDVDTIDDPPIELEKFVRTSSNVLGHRAARKIRKGSLIRPSDISLTDEDMR